MGSEYVTVGYATLEEAFGTSVGFHTPEPPVLRGDVGEVNDARQKSFQANVAKTQLFSGVGTPGVETSPKPMRLPVENARCTITNAWTIGGARAAWVAAEVPDHVRRDMVWHAVRMAIDADLVMMVMIAIAVLILLR